MKTLGINISHNASICQVTNGNIDFYLEEDRFNYQKYYHPTPKHCFFKSIDEYVKEKLDNIIIASYGSWNDIECCELISKQLNQPVEFCPTQHHLYHACAGFKLSNFDEAIVIIMDGGGAQEFCFYQEMESIYLINKQKTIRKYLHASCVRWHKYYNFKVVHPQPGVIDKHFFIDDCEYFLSNKKSMGFMFGDMCIEMGFKNKGEDSGKLMGLAAYPHQKKPKELQEYSKNYTIELLKKAFAYSDCKNVVLSGGYALNCVNNYHYVKAFPTHHFFVDPVAHDGGTAIGAALWLNDSKR